MFVLSHFILLYIPPHSSPLLRYSEIDVTIDGADEVDEHLNAIKGGGAAHLQEKVVAEAAKKFVIVADFRKNSTQLVEQVCMLCVLYF